MEKSRYALVRFMPDRFSAADSREIMDSQRPHACGEPAVQAPGAYSSVPGAAAAPGGRSASQGAPVTTGAQERAVTESGG